MSVLLDTNVLSEVWRAHGDPRVKNSVAAIGALNTFVSVITVGEIARGIALLPLLGSQRSALAQFLSEFESGYSDRILGVTQPVAHCWGEISARRRVIGSPIAPADGLIAATALHHNFTVMTRNVRNYELTGVTIIDPRTE